MPPRPRRSGGVVRDVHDVQARCRAFGDVPVLVDRPGERGEGVDVGERDGPAEPVGCALVQAVLGHAVPAGVDLVPLKVPPHLLPLRPDDPPERDRAQPPERELGDGAVGGLGHQERGVGDLAVERHLDVHATQGGGLLGRPGERRVRLVGQERVKAGLCALVVDGEGQRLREQHVGAGAGDVGRQRHMRVVAALPVRVDRATPPEPGQRADDTAAPLRGPVGRGRGRGATVGALERAGVAGPPGVPLAQLGLHGLQVGGRPSLVTDGQRHQSSSSPVSAPGAVSGTASRQWISVEKMA